VAAVGIAVALGIGGSALGLALTSSPGTPVAKAAACDSSAPKLTVQGSGMAAGKPNLLTVSVGIDVTGATVQASMADNNTRATAVTTALTQGGVRVEDVQTSDVSIQPRYDTSGVVTGYEMTNTLTAKLRNFSSAGAEVDALASAAGNGARINSLSFSIEDPRQVEDQARTDAVHQAVSHAQSMALAAGERLGPVCSLTDDSSPPGYYAIGSATAGAPSAQLAVPLQPGTQQATAQITLVYAVEQPHGR
jgi:uncharacterized protein YggE